MPWSVGELSGVAVAELRMVASFQGLGDAVVVGVVVVVVVVAGLGMVDGIVSFG